MRDDPDSGQIVYDCEASCAGELVERGSVVLPEQPALPFEFAMVIDYSMIRGEEQAKRDKWKRFPFFRLNIAISGKYRNLLQSIAWKVSSY